jgi:hypothetical protein
MTVQELIYCLEQVENKGLEIMVSSSCCGCTGECTGVEEILEPARQARRRVSSPDWPYLLKWEDVVIDEQKRVYINA